MSNFAAADKAREGDIMTSEPIARELAEEIVMALDNYLETNRCLNKLTEDKAYQDICEVWRGLLVDALVKAIRART